MLAEQERAEMLQEFWNEGCAAWDDDEAYCWDIGGLHIPHHEGSIVQDPTQVSGAEAGATGHQDAQTKAAGHELFQHSASAIFGRRPGKESRQAFVGPATI